MGLQIFLARDVPLSNVRCHVTNTLERLRQVVRQVVASHLPERDGDLCRRRALGDGVRAAGRVATRQQCETGW